jgi:hypothetical protein
VPCTLTHLLQTAALSDTTYAAYNFKASNHGVKHQCSPPSLLNAARLP